MLIESVQVSIIAHFVLMRTFKELANREDTTASFVEAREGPKEGSSRLVWRPQPSLSGSVALGSSEPEHYVFPTCENLTVDPTRPQKSWRTAWRKLVKETARRAGREVARETLDAKLGLRTAIAAYKRAAAPVRDLRFMTSGIRR
jgi:hypothetical protein